MKKIIKISIFSLMIGLISFGSILAFNNNTLKASTKPLIKSDKCLMYVNEITTLTLMDSSSNDEIKWYVNDTLQTEEKGLTYNFTTELEGIYRIYLLRNEEISNIITVEVRNKNVNVMQAIKYIDDKTISDNFDSYGNSGPVTGIGNTKDFEVINDGTNGILKSLKTEWAGSPWFCLDVNQFDLVDTYEVSFDACFKEGVYGIGGIQLGGIVSNAAYEFLCFQLNADGSSFLYANGGNGQIYNSGNKNLGGVGNTCPIKQGEWFNIRLIKWTNQIYIYVDDVLLVQTKLLFNYTKLLGVSFIQFLFDKTVGIEYDNLNIKGATIDFNNTQQDGIEVNSLELSLTSYEVNVNSMLGVELNIEPLNASYDKIEWFVNDEKTQETTTPILNYLCESLGKIKIQAKIGDVYSKPKLIDVVEEKPIELVDISNWETFKSEEFEYWTAGTSWGASNPDVLKSDGEGHIVHTPGVPYGKCGMFWDIGRGTFPLNYVLSMDFMYSTNSNGQIKFSIGGFFEDNPNDIANIYVEKNASNVSVGIFNSLGQTVLSSNSIAMGGQNKTISINYEEWHRLSFYKVEDVCAIYIDNELYACLRLNNIKNAVVNYAIVTTTFNEQPFASCTIDNVDLSIKPTESKTVEVVTLSTNTITLDGTNSAFLSANIFPVDVIYNKIEWYVNNNLINGESSDEFEFKETKSGEYKIKCIVDGIESNERTITVTVQSNNEKGCKNNKDITNIVSQFSMMILLGALLYLKKKN